MLRWGLWGGCTICCGTPCSSCWWRFFTLCEASLQKKFGTDQMLLLWCCINSHFVLKTFAQYCISYNANGLTIELHVSGKSSVSSPDDDPCRRHRIHLFLGNYSDLVLQYKNVRSHWYFHSNISGQNILGKATLRSDLCFVVCIFKHIWRLRTQPGVLQSKCYLVYWIWMMLQVCKYSQIQ